MSSPDKTSTTGTITEVKEFFEEVTPEKEQHDDDNIGGDKDLTGMNGLEKSEDITLEDTTKINIEETTNVETEKEQSQITLDDMTKLNTETEGTTNTETEDVKEDQKE